MNNNKNNVLLVTGGGGGIGSAIALKLCGPNVKVLVLDTNADKAEQVVQHIKSAGGQAAFMPIEVSVKDSVERTVKEIMQSEGHIDGLVNWAGMSIRGDTLDVDEKDWDRVLDVNLKGTLFCCQVVGREMIRQKSGAIVNVASNASMAALSRRAAYCASKAGVVALTQVLAVEWADHGIRVNAVSPSYTRTAMVEEAIAGGFVNEAQIKARSPLKRLAEPSEIAEVVDFLLSNRSSFITGVNLPVDGGWAASLF
jgi:NAD(P)-dependent dehydrogenase (short-subunit alcohol dehydrogenase family)